MQSTGHSSTQARSLTSMQGSAITNVMPWRYPEDRAGKRHRARVKKRCRAALFASVPNSGTHFRYVEDTSEPPKGQRDDQAGNGDPVALRVAEGVVPGALRP